MRNAFTLSELLISLSVLGLIAALTLPAVFTSVDKQRKKAVFKESIQIIQEALAIEFNEGQPLDSQASIEAALVKRLNTTVDCPANTTTPTCLFKTGTTESTFDAGFRKYKLHNGALVFAQPATTSTTTPNLYHPFIIIDWNGNEAGTNAYGEDQLVAIFANVASNQNVLSTFYNLPFRPGELKVVPGTYQTALISELF